MGCVGSNTDYKAISVQLQLQLPTGTELGNIQPEQKIDYLKGIVVTSRFPPIQADTDPLKL